MQSKPCKNERGQITLKTKRYCHTTVWFYYSTYGISTIFVLVKLEGFFSCAHRKKICDTYYYNFSTIYIYCMKSPKPIKHFAMLSLKVKFCPTLLVKYTVSRTQFFRFGRNSFRKNAKIYLASHKHSVLKATI